MSRMPKSIKKPNSEVPATLMTNAVFAITNDLFSAWSGGIRELSNATSPADAYLSALDSSSRITARLLAHTRSLVASPVIGMAMKPLMSELPVFEPMLLKTMNAQQAKLVQGLDGGVKMWKLSTLNIQNAAKCFC